MNTLKRIFMIQEASTGLFVSPKKKKSLFCNPMIGLNEIKFKVLEIILFLSIYKKVPFFLLFFKCTTKPAHMFFFF